MYRIGFWVWVWVWVQTLVPVQNVYFESDKIAKVDFFINHHLKKQKHQSRIKNIYFILMKSKKRSYD